MGLTVSRLFLSAIQYGGIFVLPVPGFDAVWPDASHSLGPFLYLASEEDARDAETLRLLRIKHILVISDDPSTVQQLTNVLDRSRDRVVYEHLLHSKVSGTDLAAILPDVLAVPRVVDSAAAPPPPPVTAVAAPAPPSDNIPPPIPEDEDAPPPPPPPPQQRFGSSAGRPAASDARLDQVSRLATLELKKGIEFLEKEMAEAEGLPRSDTGSVQAHLMLVSTNGCQRAGLVAAGFIRRKLDSDLSVAIEKVRQNRGCFNPNQEMRDALHLVDFDVPESKVRRWSWRSSRRWLLHLVPMTPTFLE